MKHLFVAFGCVVLAAGPVRAEFDARSASFFVGPESSADAPVRRIRPELAQKIDEVFRFATYGRHPGCELGLIYRGQVLYAKSYGMAELETSRAYTVATPTNIGAVSTQFTAACIALLHMRNQLDLDDPVSKFFPGLSPFRGMTVRHLVYHTSGLPRRHGPVVIAPIGPDYTNADVLKGLLRRAQQDPDGFLLARPGQLFSYSNIGYVLLAEIIRKVTGQTLRQFAAENIFQKLGMRQTQFWENHSNPIGNMARAYKLRIGREFDRFESSEQTIGDGGLVTSAEDLVRWDQNFYHNQLGYGSELIRLLLTQGPSVRNDGQAPFYGFGLNHTVAETAPRVDCIYHSGKDSGYEADMRRFPQREFSIIILGNMDALHPVALGERVLAICRAANFNLY
jgi:CubicO group peptidase (beta-lactamase class C family)